MSDVVIVDASVALKWVLIEQVADAALALLNQWTNEGRYTVPWYWDNSYWKKS